MADETLNVKKSFESRVAAQLEISVPVDYQGIDFDKAAQDEWIEPRLLGETPSPTRRGERFELWTAQFNVYARTGFDEFNAQKNPTHRIWQLVDIVLRNLCFLPIQLETLVTGSEAIINGRRCEAAFT